MKQILLTSIIIISLFSSCRKELEYLEKTEYLDITVSVPDLDSLWGEDWRSNLLFEWEEWRYGEIGYPRPKKFCINIFNYNHGEERYSYNKLAMLGTTEFSLGFGSYALTIHSHDLPETEMQIKSNTIIANNSETQEIFYYGRVRNVDYSRENYEVDIENYEWKRLIECNLTTPHLIYIFQFPLRGTYHANHNITASYITNIQNNFDLHKGATIGEECHIINNSMHKVSDTLFMCRSVLYNNINNTNKKEIILNYSNLLHNSIPIRIEIDSVLRNRPYGGVITLPIDIDKIIEEYNPEEEENINWGVTLQDRETEHIILNV